MYRFVPELLIKMKQIKTKIFRFVYDKIRWFSLRRSWFYIDFSLKMWGAILILGKLWNCKLLCAHWIVIADELLIWANVDILSVICFGKRNFSWHENCSATWLQVVTRRLADFLVRRGLRLLFTVFATVISRVLCWATMHANEKCEEETKMKHYQSEKIEEISPIIYHKFGVKSRRSWEALAEKNDELSSFMMKPHRPSTFHCFSPFFGV